MLTLLITGEIKDDNNDYGLATVFEKDRVLNIAEKEALNLGALVPDMINKDFVIDQTKMTIILNDKRKTQKEKIKQAMLYERNNTASVFVNINGVNQKINAQERSLTDCSALKKKMIRENLQNIDYRDFNNVPFAIVPADLDTIEIAIENNGFSLYAKKWALESQIDAALTITDIELINW